MKNKSQKQSIIPGNLPGKRPVSHRNYTWYCVLQTSLMTSPWMFHFESLWRKCVYSLSHTWLTCTPLSAASSLWQKQPGFALWATTPCCFAFSVNSCGAEETLLLCKVHSLMVIGRERQAGSVIQSVFVRLFWLLWCTKGKRMKK